MTSSRTLKLTYLKWFTCYFFSAYSKFMANKTILYFYCILYGYVYILCLIIQSVYFFHISSSLWDPRLPDFILGTRLFPRAWMCRKHPATPGEASLTPRTPQSLVRGRAHLTPPTCPWLPPSHPPPGQSPSALSSERGTSQERAAPWVPPPFSPS